MDIEGIIAVGGFWLCMVLLIFRGAIKERLLKSDTPLLSINKGEVSEMKARLQTLEARVTAMNHEILELQEGQEFDRRLLDQTERATERTAKAISAPAIPSIRTAITSPSALRRPGLPQK